MAAKGDSIGSLRLDVIDKRGKQPAFDVEYAQGNRGTFSQRVTDCSVGRRGNKRVGNGFDDFRVNRGGSKIELGEAGAI